MSANANASAIPILVSIGDGHGEWRYSTVGGLTKREIFAAMAMQGLLANNDVSHAWRGLQAEAVRADDAAVYGHAYNVKP